MTQRRGSRIDRVRTTAFRAITAVTGDGAYANIVGSKLISEAGLAGRDAALATELINGTCRGLGSYELIIEAASGRSTERLDPDVVDLLCLGTHQLLATRIPDHAAISTSVDLARQVIGPQVAGLVNAILRKVSRHPLDEWLDRLAQDADPMEALAIRTQHPRWIAEAISARLGDEAGAALHANNQAPTPTLVALPGLSTVAELEAAGATLGGPSPLQASWTGNPAKLNAVREGRAGVQDAGSQLVALALARAAAPAGPWLDLCAGPGGKAALLASVAAQEGTALVAAEKAPHRAQLVAAAVRAVEPPPVVLCADGTRPGWQPGRFAKVLADVPCTGLGALRRRPEARWRHQPEDLDELIPLQRALLASALEACIPGGVVAYVTCSPHAAETIDVVTELVRDRADVTLEPLAGLLPEVADAIEECAGGEIAQLWPHRHGTDAMFLAMFRRSG